MLQKLMVLLVSLMLSGCFFSAKEIVLDPDKGYTHSNNGGQKWHDSEGVEVQPEGVSLEGVDSAIARKDAITVSRPE